MNPGTILVVVIVAACFGLSIWGLIRQQKKEDAADRARVVRTHPPATQVPPIKFDPPFLNTDLRKDGLCHGRFSFSPKP